MVKCFADHGAILKLSLRAGSLSVYRASVLAAEASERSELVRKMGRGKVSLHESY